MSDSVINVAIMIDAAEIIGKYQKGGDDPDHSVKIDGGFYMVTESTNVATGQGSASLQIKAMSEGEGDDGLSVVRWREYTISHAAYQCFIQDIVVTDGDSCISTPVLSVLNPMLLVHVSTDVTQPLSRQAVPDYFWEAAVQDSGLANYGIQIQIFDLTQTPDKPTPLGYFQLDSSIKVVDR